MPNLCSPNSSNPPARRKFFLAVAAVAAVATLGVITSRPADAHHGWASFETKRAYFAAGTIEYVRWGNPHSEVHLRIDETALPSNWTQRTLPPGADKENARATIASARPYGGEHKQLHLVLAGPSWMQQWGLERPLKVGEKIEVVGFVGASDSEELRPVMFWLEDGQGVWQQLTPFPEKPEPAPQSNG